MKKTIHTSATDLTGIGRLKVFKSFKGIRFFGILPAMLCLGMGSVAYAGTPAATPLTDLLKGRQPLPAGMYTAPPETASVTTLTDARPTNGKRQAAAEAPSKTSAHYGDIYGYMSYCNTPGFIPGVYAVKTGSISKMWDDPVYTEKGYRLSTGWYAGGKVCGFASERAFGQLIGIYYTETNLASGAMEKCEQIDPRKGYFSIATYSSSDDCIYGYGITPAGDVAWIKAPATSPTDIEMVRKASIDVDICYSLCYQPLGENFYGMTVAHQFVVIEKDGSVFNIREIPDAETLSTYRSGMVYSPFDQQYYWNAITTAGESLFYEIDLGGYMEAVHTFPNGEEFDFLFTTDVPLAPGQPDKPLMKEIVFEGNSLDGTGVYEMPSLVGGGDHIEGELHWTAMADGYICDRGTSQAGETVTANYSCVLDGMHQLEFFVSLDGIESQHVINAVYVGNDIPSTPANVVLTPTGVSWDAVTTGAHGGYIDTSVMYYIVYVDGYLKAFATGGDTHADIEIGDGEYSTHIATVVASCNSLKSGEGVSNPLACGRPLSLPLNIKPTVNEYAMLMVEDSNHDGATWSHNPDDGSIEATYSMFLPMDDWIFLPPVDLQATDRYYTFSLTANARSARFGEEFIEVVAFNDTPAAAAGGTVVLERFKPEYQKQRYTGAFMVPEAGTYYVGIHCVSAADMYGVQVRDISLVDNNVTMSSPAPVTGISATGAEEGRLTADIHFTLPTLAMDGSTLPEGTELTVTVEGAETVRQTGTPGSGMSCTVPTVQGKNIITVYVSSGENNSIPANTEVFTGVDKPMTVQNFHMEATDDMLGLTLSWDPPIESVTGGYFDPATVEYEVMVPVQQIFGVTWETIHKCGTQRRFEFRVPDGTPMDIMEFGVLATNAAGDCGNMASSRALVGTPHNLPIEEDFEDPDTPMKFEPWLTYGTGSDASFGVMSVGDLSIAPGSGDKVLYGHCTDENGMGILGLPRFSTAGTDGAHMEMMLLCGDWAPAITILAQKHGQPVPETIHTCNISGEGFREIVFDLPDEYAGEKWVQLYLQCDFHTGSEVFMADHINIRSGTTGVETIASETSAATVTVEGNTIVVYDTRHGDTKVYSPDGKLAGTAGLADDTARITVAPGIYIVTSPSQCVKVVVK